MDEFEYEGKTLDEITAHLASVRDALAVLFAAEDPTPEQVEEATKLTAVRKDAEAKINEIETAAAEQAAAWASMKDEFSDEGDDDGEEPVDEPTDDEDAVEEGDDEVEADTEDEVEETTTVEAKTAVRTLSRKNKRPQPPSAPRRSPVVLTASADVPDFATGSRMNGLEDWAKATLGRAKGFPKHNQTLARAVRHQTGQTQQLHKFGTASMSIEFPDELTIKKGSDDYAVSELARDWRRPESAKGKGIQAAGGWCAPSQTVYDLCDIESLDGIIDIAEFGVQRGGVNHTKGPTFADVFEDGAFGFLQTEADAIAGETKDCMTIECPDFETIRMDAIGYCVKIPILTEVGYPELIRRYLQLATLAYARKVNKETVSRIVTGSTAKSVSGLGAVLTDTLEGLEILADQWRSSFALSLNHPFEVKVPHWVKAAYRSDLARRNSIALEAVTDADLAAHFTARNLNVQYIFDLQAGPTGTQFPSTYLMLMYPAGQWARGMQDVISLSTVYDAASLAVNTYTGVFFEQGMLVLDGCYDSFKVTMPICTAGLSGAAVLTCEGS